MGVAQSALIVPVPEMERFVSALRELHDPSALLGVPAHITVLFPFFAPPELGAAVVASLSRIAKSLRCFPFHLTSVGRFPEAVYLSPQPTEPFVELTRAVETTFPAYKPYGGRYPSVVPHLTVAHGANSMHDSVASQLQSVIGDIAVVQCTCSQVVLIENSAGRWRTSHAFALRPAMRDAG